MYDVDSSSLMHSLPLTFVAAHYMYAHKYFRVNNYHIYFKLKDYENKI